jgi:hypothetical protein
MLKNHDAAHLFNDGYDMKSENNPIFMEALQDDSLYGKTILLSKFVKVDGVNKITAYKKKGKPA